MALREQDVGRIGEHTKPWVRELIDRMIPRAEFGGIGTQLLERAVRVVVCFTGDGGFWHPDRVRQSPRQ